MSAFTSQNFGAKKYSRIREGLKVCLIIALITYVSLGSIMVFLPETIAGFMLNEQESIKIAAQFLPICGITIFAVDFLFVFRSAVQGMGYPFIPMCSGIAEMVMRVSVIVLFISELGFRATAYASAKAGVDMIAPSDMMDGHIESLRSALDQNGYVTLPIMGYSAKYASSYYGPFREAAHSAPGFGDRKSYQMDYANGKEAMREIEADINEGVDIIMVKPALSYLDVVKEASMRFDVPLCVYNVSGEYSMLKLAVEQGLMKEDVIEETLLSMKRAGAKIIITYFALELAKKWKEGK